jgi:hypothetical protein
LISDDNHKEPELSQLVLQLMDLELDGIVHLLLAALIIVAYINHYCYISFHSKLWAEVE